MAEWQNGDAVHVAPSKLQLQPQPTSISNHFPLLPSSVSDVNILPKKRVLLMAGKLKQLWLCGSSVHPIRHPPFLAAPSNGWMPTSLSAVRFLVRWYTCTTLHRHPDTISALSALAWIRSQLPWEFHVAFSRCRQVSSDTMTLQSVSCYIRSRVLNIGFCPYLCKTHHLFSKVSAVVGYRLVFRIARPGASTVMIRTSVQAHLAHTIAHTTL